MLGYLNITEQVTGRPISGGGAPPSPASRWLAAATSTQTLASRAPATEARTPSQERMQSRAGTRTLWCSGGSRRQRPSRGNSPARPGIAPHETARIMRIQWGKVRLSFHRNNHFCIYLVYLVHIRAEKETCKCLRVQVIQDVHKKNIHKMHNITYSILQ